MRSDQVRSALILASLLSLKPQIGFKGPPSGIPYLIVCRLLASTYVYFMFRAPRGRDMHHRLHRDMSRVPLSPQGVWRAMADLRIAVHIVEHYHRSYTNDTANKLQMFWLVRSLDVDYAISSALQQDKMMYETTIILVTSPVLYLLILKRCGSKTAVIRRFRTSMCQRRR
jgi:hypothetical protein